MKSKPIIIISFLLIVAIAGLALGLYFAFRPPPAVGAMGVTDDLGRTVPIEGVPQRVVSLSPGNTETLFLLGVGDRVVGVSGNFAGDAWLGETPKEVAEQINAGIKAGEIAALKFPYSATAIRDLDPEVVFLFGYTLPSYGATLEDLGVPVVVLAPNSVEGVLENIELVGRIMGVEDRARGIVEALRDRSAAVVASVQDKPRPRVFYEVWYNGGLWTTGAGSFVGNLIYLSGGIDIGTAVPVANSQIGEAYVIDRDPEVIILSDAPYGVTAESVAARSGWAETTAVKEGKVYALERELVDKLNRPGPRIVDGLEQLVKLIHPEVDR